MAENLGSIRYDVEVDTAGALQAEMVIDKVTNNIESDFKQTEAAVTKASATMSAQTKGAAKVMNTEMTKAAKGVKRGVQANLGQAGIQVQQFVGQLQGGQSAMVALAQQSADLGIVLGAPLVGVVVSLAAVLIGTLAPALFDSGKKVDELREKLEKLVEANSLTREQADVLINAEQKKNKEREKSIKKLKEEEKAIRSQIALSDNVVKNYDKESDTYKNLAKGKDNLTNKLNENIASQQVLNLEIGESTDKIKTYNSVVTDEQIPITKQQKSSIDSLVESIKVKSETIGLTARGIALYSAEQILNTEAQKENLAAVKERINASFDTIEAYEDEQAAIKQTTSDLEWYEQQLLKIKDAEKKDIERGQTFAQGVIESGMTEPERLQAEIEELEALRAKDLENRQLYNDAIAVTEQKKADAVEAAKEKEVKSQALFNQSQSQLLGSVGSLIGAYADNMEVEDKKSFEKKKKFQTAQALINTAMAVSNALAAAPPPVSYALAAAAGAMGAMQVSAIQGQEYSGGREFGGPVSAGSMYRVGEKGKPEFYKDNLGNLSMIPGENGEVIPSDKVGGSGGGMTVEVNNYTPYQVYVTQDQAANIANVQIGKEAGKLQKGRGNMYNAMKAGGKGYSNNAKR